MASKRKLRRKSCDGKAKHDREGAIVARKKLLKSGETNIGCYKCKFCGHYHVGHLNKKRLQSLIRYKK
jgi:hypothetical protein